MVQRGKLCLDCHTRCVDVCPEEKAEVDIDCTECDGEGCEHCTDGRMPVEACPYVVIGPRIGELTRYARLFEKGAMPVSGGVLDQDHWFIEATDYLATEQAKWNGSLPGAR